MERAMETMVGKMVPLLDESRRVSDVRRDFTSVRTLSQVR